MSKYYSNGGMIGADIAYDDYEPYIIGQNTTPTRLKPKYVGGRSQGYNATATDITFSLTGLGGGLATAPADGDFVIVSFMTSSTVDRALTTSSTGWTELTELYSDNTNASTNDVNLTVFYKRMGTTPDTSIVLRADAGGTGDGTLDGAGVVCQVWRGIDATTPLDVAVTTATGIASRNPNPPSITPSTTNALVIAIGACSYITNNDTFTVPTNFTEFLQAQASSTNDGNVGIASFKDWVSGAVDPAVFTNGTTSTNGAWAAYTIALRPSLTDVITPIYGQQKNSGVWSVQGQYEARLNATIVVVGSSWSNTYSSLATSINVVAPRNIRNGDLIIVFAGNSDATGTAQFDDATLKPTGFTLINQISTSNADASVAAWYKYAVGTEGETTISIPAQSSQYMWGGIAVVRNQQPANPVNVTGTNLDNASATVHEVPAVTTTVDKCLAFFVLSSDGSDVLPFAFAGTGWSSERTVTTFDTIDQLTDLNGIAGMFGWKYIPTAGTTNIIDIAFAGAGGADGCAGFQFAIDGVI